jgi:hypothetical protein
MALLHFSFVGLLPRWLKSNSPKVMPMRAREIGGILIRIAVQDSKKLQKMSTGVQFLATD